MIYLDNAATTPVHPDVLAQMMPYLGERYGNPSSLYRLGRESKAAVEQARDRLGVFLGCDPHHLVFTSGGTEANHTALLGAFLARPDKRHVITTAIEHHAVLHTCDFLRSLGAEVTVVNPNRAGKVEVQDVVDALRPDTGIVSMMAVNNEMGTIQPVHEAAIAVKAKDPEVLVHSDVVQAVSQIRLDLDASSLDFATIAAHKFHGPKGVGALYIRPGTPWRPVMHGGTQERERRAGTENVAGAVGLGAAAARLHRDFEGHVEHISQVAARFWEHIQEIPDVRRNSPVEGVPGILNVAFAGVKSDRLLMRLDLEGVAASAGSACTAGSLEPSHVLLACGMPERDVAEAVRFSFSEMTPIEDIDRAADIVKRVVGELRERAASRF